MKFRPQSNKLNFTPSGTLPLPPSPKTKLNVIELGLTVLGKATRFFFGSRRFPPFSPDP